MSHSTAPKNLADVLGNLTLDRIKAVADTGRRATLEALYAVVVGIATAYFAVKGDVTFGDSEKLASVSLTLEDAQGFVADGLHMLAEIADHDAKHAIYLASTAALNATDRAITQHLTSVNQLLRGKFGAKSPTLENYGVTPLAPGGRHKAAPLSPPSK